MLMLGVGPTPLHDAGANGTPMAPAKVTVTHTTVHHSSQTVPTGTAIIWCGLWNGSNFNFTDSCANIGDGSSHVTIHHTSVSTSTQSEPQSVSATNTTVTASNPSDTDTDNDTDTAAAQSSSTASSSSSNNQSTSDTSNTCTSTCTSGDTQTVPTGTAVIWCGLISGSNFNVNDNCANIGDGSPTVTLPANLDQPGTAPAGSTNQSDPPATTSSDPPATTNAMTASTATSSNPPAANTSGGTYAALGDSVAAGLGLPLPANADAATTACGRSAEGYPNLVASSMNMSLINESCSGATMGDLITPEDVNGVEQKAQLDQVFASGVPKLVSITAGANDMEWATFLKQCAAANCATTANTVAVDGLLVTLQAKMLATLSSIQLRSNGHPPTTVVTGYYQPVSMACAQNGMTTSANVAWIRAATNALNQTLKQTAQEFSFARFAPVDFTGHDICSSSSWLQGTNSAAPFHPTAQGQQQIAQDVEAAMH